MRNYNLIVIEGNLTRDPEFSYSQRSNTPMLKFSIANNYTSIDKNGQKVEEVSYFDISSFGTTAEIFSKYLKKGKRVIVTGKIRQYRWNDGEQRKSKMKILADDISFVSSGKKKYYQHVSEEKVG
jgi:single-strand DNA-binding protein